MARFARRTSRLAAVVSFLPAVVLAAVPDDVRWAEGFNIGSNGPFQVEAMVPYGTGLVMGGAFNVVNGVLADNVAFTNRLNRDFGL